MQSSDSPDKPSSDRNWYADWFDTPYYHTLYKDRDYREAKPFIDNITAYLNLEEGAKVLDLACGKGRHSIYLNKLGYDVTGADLSRNSIAEAARCANESLRFEVHDMRVPFDQKFDAILNMFTSFGYFENDGDNLETLRAMRDSLSEYGLAVIDFMNVEKTLDNLVASEVKTVDGITFHLTRSADADYIYKEIRFEDQGVTHQYTERVRALRLADFERLMEQAGIFLLDVFGDYRLRKFHPRESERLILIFK